MQGSISEDERNLYLHTKYNGTRTVEIQRVPNSDLQIFTIPENSITIEGLTVTVVGADEHFIYFYFGPLIIDESNAAYLYILEEEGLYYLVLDAEKFNKILCNKIELETGYISYEITDDVYEVGIKYDPNEKDACTILVLSQEDTDDDTGDVLRVECVNIIDGVTQLQLMPKVIDRRIEN